MSSDGVVPFEAIPDRAGKTVVVDGKPYLVINDAMFTFYQRSMGELSPFFYALRDEKRILGCKCVECGIVRVPPFLLRCPDCDFAPTELVEVGDVGRMLSTPPITYFANSLFQQQVPFGRGRIVLSGADTAMSVNFYTTRGILVPGIVTRGTEMKVVFRDQRFGEITDIFCVSTAELTPEQIASKGIQESDLTWAAAQEPELPLSTEESIAGFGTAYAALAQLASEMRQCERARKDIENWKRDIRVKTLGGEFGLRIDNGNLYIEEEPPASPDLVMVCQDPAVLLDGLSYRGSLTQAIIRRELWINRNAEFTTIFKLERMARSLARSKKG